MKDYRENYKLAQVNVAALIDEVASMPISWGVGWQGLHRGAFRRMVRYCVTDSMGERGIGEAKTGHMLVLWHEGLVTPLGRAVMCEILSFTRQQVLLVLARIKHSSVLGI